MLEGCCKGSGPDLCDEIVRLKSRGVKAGKPRGKNFAGRA
jgi:hypothetical protein